MSPVPTTDYPVREGAVFGLRYSYLWGFATGAGAVAAVAVWGGVLTHEPTPVCAEPARYAVELAPVEVATVEPSPSYSIP